MFTAFFGRPSIFPEEIMVYPENQCSTKTIKMQSYVAIGGRQVEVATVDSCSCNWEEPGPSVAIIDVLDVLRVSLFKFDFLNVAQNDSWRNRHFSIRFKDTESTEEFFIQPNQTHLELKKENK